MSPGGQRVSGFLERKYTQENNLLSPKFRGLYHSNNKIFLYCVIEQISSVVTTANSIREASLVFLSTSWPTSLLSISPLNHSLQLHYHASNRCSWYYSRIDRSIILLSFMYSVLHLRGRLPCFDFPRANITIPVNWPRRMTGKPKLVNTHSQKYYPIRPKIP
jgi:hypothetical protein